MIPKIISTVITVISLSIISSSCSKSSQNDNTTLQIRLTDAPAAYSQINVDIKAVRINFNDDSTGWVNLNTNAGVFNLLNFQNGVDTVLASGIVPVNTVKQIRLILGTNNTVVDNGVVYPLQLSSQDESGLKIKISKKLNLALESIVIDFDAAQSVVKENNGTYKLRPVLKLK